MQPSYSLLISINYLSTSGGVARVARLISETLPFNEIFSFHGNSKEKGVKYFNKNPIKFLSMLFWSVVINSPKLIVFDHIGPASLLKFIPSIFLKNKKIVIFLHDEEAWNKVSKRHSWGLEKATHILCNSEYTYQKFINSNPSFASITKVCLLAGVPATFKNSEKIDVCINMEFINLKYCLFVSRLWKEHRYKGYLELVEAFKILNDGGKREDLHLLIIGRGNDTEFLKENIETSRLSEFVHVLSNINDHELVKYYQNSVALVFPSIREGFGFVFLEAMFCGKPCIGVKGQPAEEIILNEITGILMKDNTPQSIEKTIKEILSSPGKFKSMGEEGRKLYYEKFDNIHFKKRFLECLGYLV